MSLDEGNGISIIQELGELHMLLTLALMSVLHGTLSTDSIAGKWQITGDVVGNAVKTTCTIIQANSTLTGNCTNAEGVPLVLTGEVKEGKVTFQYDIDYQGQPLTVVYSATLASPREFKGTIDVRPVGAAGTFAAVAVAAKP
ncbi:hypothetical protein BH11GEM1_BH11GEM1_03010 [soil metagenome]